MKKLSRTLFTCIIALNFASCGKSEGGTTIAPNGEFDHPPVVATQAQHDFEFDGTQPEFQAGLAEDVMKQEWVDVPYQDTCVRQVFSHYENVCETRYRDEQRCDWQQQCTQERECRIVQKCNQEQVCRNERECRNENVCRPEQVCRNEQQCRDKQVCTTRQECRDQQVCHDERKCEYINGERVCRIEKVCQNKPVCRPVQDCRTERVCETRPVCHTENRCHTEQVCRDVPRCHWENKCRDERVCEYVPKCRNEYVCRNERVPYQDCRQEPRYRDEYYTCTKTRPELQSVLDYHHVADVKVVFENILLPQGAKDQFRVVTRNGQVELLVGNVTSGLVYYHTVSAQTQNVGPQDRFTQAVITVRAIDALAAQELVRVMNFKADRSGVRFEKLPIALIQDFEIKARLTVRRTGPTQPKVLIDRDLLPTEMKMLPATTVSQLVEISFKDLRIDKETVLKGDFRVEMELRLVPLTPFKADGPNAVPLKSQSATDFRN